ncbi:MAG: type II toxin-antitoxin system RelE/ParE family toxin, partial [Acidobacteriota bacterium]|nr:type II toxin-antitoxin system RelE/ParE family toxin [Acidobacteriota bacterium]
MGWDIEFTDEFEGWWSGLTESEQGKVDAAVRALEASGPNLPYPLSSDVKGSRHGQMRELRIQAHGRPFRVLYAFNPKRNAILLVGGDKTGNDRWYEVNV